ncbi:MAG: transcriptional regulator [Planctomycetota bacterium]
MGRERKTVRPTTRAPHDYVGLDRVLHEKARLGILIALLNRKDGIAFPELRTLCELTDGNLSRHLTVLQEAGIVDVEKSNEGPRPKTTVRLSKTGRKQFLAYLEELERVLRDARGAQSPATRPGLSPG